MKPAENEQIYKQWFCRKLLDVVIEQCIWNECNRSFLALRIILPPNLPLVLFQEIVRVKIFSALRNIKPENVEFLPIRYPNRIFRCLHHGSSASNDCYYPAPIQIPLRQCQA